ncbi:hypothetical protein [uncultured Shewanella sp.]|uniref:hypothetical protein n=1 Tax=uncultured Shewanella sp. TaxID=173975 RepID=UPI00260D7B3F|nr:hypothetical protein [uncultured Shewanella sp.]
MIFICVTSCGESSTSPIDKIQETESQYFTPTLTAKTLASAGSTQLTLFSGTRISRYLNHPEFFPTETALPFCVWLSPDTEGQATLDAIVKENIEETSCPFFDAHITLFCGNTHLPKQALINQFTTAFANNDSTQADIIGTQWGTDFFKRFYYQMENNTQLQNLSNTSKSTLDSDATYSFDPHISLFYGNDSDIPENKVLAAPHLNSLTFNQIRLMSDCANETYTCVASWEEYASISLNE